MAKDCVEGKFRSQSISTAVPSFADVQYARINQTEFRLVNKELCFEVMLCKSQRIYTAMTALC